MKHAKIIKLSPLTIFLLILYYNINKNCTCKFTIQNDIISTGPYKDRWEGNASVKADANSYACNYTIHFNPYHKLIPRPVVYIYIYIDIYIY